MRWLRVLACLLVVSPSWATYSLVSAAHIGAGSTDTNTFTTSAIDTTSVTFLVAAVGFFSAISLTDSKSNSWTCITIQTNTSSNTSEKICYVVNPIVGSGHTFTLTGATTYGSIAVQGFTGNASTPLDQQTGTTGVGSATWQAGNVAPTQDNELALAAYSQAAVVGTMTIDSGFSITDQTPVGSGAHFGIALAYKILGAGTSGVNVNPTWTNGSGADQPALTNATFKTAAASAVGNLMIISENR